MLSTYTTHLQACQIYRKSAYRINRQVDMAHQPGLERRGMESGGIHGAIQRLCLFSPIVTLDQTEKMIDKNTMRPGDPY